MWFWTNIVGLMCMSSLVGIVAGHAITNENIHWVEWIIPLYLFGVFIYVFIKNIKDEHNNKE